MKYTAREHRIRKLSPAEAAYLAGLLDNRGTLGIRGRGTCTIGIYSKRPAILEWLRSVGGNVSLERRPSRDVTIRHKDSTVYHPAQDTRNRWNVAALADVYEILRLTAPYLQHDREKVREMFAICGRKTGQKTSRPPTACCACGEY